MSESIDVQKSVGQQINDTSEMPFDRRHLFCQDRRVGAHAACTSSRICR